MLRSCFHKWTYNQSIIALIAFSRQLISLIVNIQIAFQIWRLFVGASFKFSCEGGEKLWIFVSWLLPRRVCIASRKKKHIEHIIERCLIAKKNSFKERTERDFKCWCKRCRRVNRQFSAPSVRVFVLDLC